MDKQISSNTRYIENVKLDRIFASLLLLYSLLPGLSKVVEIQGLLVINIIIIAYLFYSKRKIIRKYQIDIFLLFFLCYIIIQTMIVFINPEVNKTGLIMGFYLNVIPILGYFISKSIPFDVYVRILLKIIIVHCIIGIILYPAFGITDRSLFVVDKLLDGVAFGRMSSVSGSLPFGNLMMIGFILSFIYDKRYLPLILFCLVFSGQRSAWVGAFIFVLIYFFSQFKQVKILNIVRVFLVTILFLIIAYFIVDKVLNIDLEFIYSRFAELDQASTGRTSLWYNGLLNFRDYPLGVGVGQVGQVASRFEDAVTGFRLVPDGDYFRILSEYGFVGGAFYIVLIFLFCVLLLFNQFSEKSNLAILGLLAGNLFQMIGSNISEFYFSNFLYWMCIGYFFNLARQKIIFASSMKKSQKKLVND